MFEGKKIIDITPVVSSQLGVFPGDISFSRDESMSTKKGHHITLSSINTTLHLGAHADATNHYHEDGKGIEAKNLEDYLGKVQVIEVDIERSKRIFPEDIHNKEIKAKRILFKTNSFPDPNIWNSDFNSLSPELIKFLAGKGVKLIGIDTPSVDPEEAKELTSHLEIYKNNISILEGLVLEDVIEGLYQLIALPLKLKDADASPVRAILIDSD